ncbi:MAG: NCS2 family permease [Bifidobacteriaceae bacterium]|jgi:AGZA family xanthine/uracil permease-like MFS transporter|nr:NCS2 family permease [Bifidobacteriaceae bacterium]
MAKTPPAAKAPAAPRPTNVLDRYFKITERGSSFGQEIRGGLVTFFAMSYIIVLNPLILGGAPSAQGTYIGGGAAADIEGVAVMTSLVAGFMTILMGVVANFPLALAAGLGINAIVTYSLAQIPGASFADAMGIVVLEGIIILFLVLTGFRKAVFKAVPTQLKIAISVGIGLFIAFVGLIDARFATYGSTLQLGEGGTSLLHSWPVLVFVVGLLIAIILTVRKVKGALLIAIVTSTILAIIIEAVAKLGSSVENPRGWALNVPKLVNEGWLPKFGVFGDFSIVGAFKHMGVLVAVLMVFSLLLADFFDTMGTMVAIGAEADLLDKEGNPPKTQEILIVDSVGAIAGGVGGVSSNTSYIESAAGVGEGARTGFASIITGICFLLSMFLAPLVKMVPYEAATPALVVVGFLMMMQVSGIDWRDIEVALPAFLTIILMPFTYSITVGIGAGFVSFVLIKVAKGKFKQVHPLMWITAILFVIYFAQGPINSWLS